MTATSRALRSLAASRRELAKIMAGPETEMVKAWARAWLAIADDLEAALLANDGRTHRLQHALKVSTDSLNALSHNFTTNVGANLGRVMATSVAATEALVRAQMPPRWAMRDRVDPRQMDAIIERTQKRITSRMKPIASDTMALIKDELVQGVVQGRNPRETARLIMRKAQDHYNLGINRALVITRTEQLDAYRTAAQRTMATHDDVLAGWQWVTSLSNRTCPSCIAMHGTEHKLSEPGPLDHPCGRCARLPITKSWRELGFDLDEPKDALPDKHAFWDGLSDREQKSILGPKRYEAYQQGDYPMEKWSERRKNPGWRDSYQVSKIN